MNDLTTRALAAKRESKHIEFKEMFDPDSPGDWCELIKDIVAIANSGGGVIVFGVDSLGTPTGIAVESIARIDPADISNKLSKYTGSAQIELDVTTAEKGTHPLILFLIEGVATPAVFERPGTYDVGSGKQRTAFGVGTVYFRHGAKSEPGTNDDIRRCIERQLEHARKSWMKNVRKVVQAPPGSQIIAVPAAEVGAKPILVGRVRPVEDRNALPVRLTRDPTLASGTFVHEQISDGIFDEVNNIVDANRILANGRPAFFLTQPVYYRIYADRERVRQSEVVISSLLRSGIGEFYAPALYWTRGLADVMIAQLLVELYLSPTHRYSHSLIRIAPILGARFSHWLHEQWTAKWGGHSQPPSFYFSLKRILDDSARFNPLLVAARVSKSSRIDVPGHRAMMVKEILDSPTQATQLLSEACLCVVNGNTACRATSRTLDYLAYGQEMQQRGAGIADAFIKNVGNRPAGDVVNATELE